MCTILICGCCKQLNICKCTINRLKEKVHEWCRIVHSDWMWGDLNDFLTKGITGILLTHDHIMYDKSCDRSEVEKQSDQCHG